ncbi:uncharacterized protein RCC_04500 [Ramularia collo-cygni]|uniref:Mediator of RNA polymerase II transcription subunit 14 n=1 Tax=Ramularia collo-cygni TaxID=112498 RepID=A0A2D3V542_9PEZI|nr:uncharacterized protein RCC_04500 [Ramularia collo-cygni]CZT18656.1 uncharacterized protein RCC_04500 [Ramularia collo-cygni]
MTKGLPTPPEIDQSWRQSDANKPMGVMMERLAQQCMADLNDTLTKMAEAPQAPAQANGIVPHATDTSEASLSRKRALIEFAHNQRDRFIKTLVLSDWARNADDMARLVDIKVWQEKQVAAQHAAMRFIGTMKTNMAGAKMPNPNIEGALELLATGKASHIPDLGYLPPKRLTAKQLLRTLQDMNVALATRLNLHEELPFHFNDFSIANGRATFQVPQEFEVDLSVADEDTSTPFYFIDIRFLFNPAPTLSDEGLRGVLENHANIALAKDGTKGCYDLIHNFVLTHKINVLRDQTFNLLREKWFDCLVVELKKRVLIIQYWSIMPGPKSWLEIGVSTGRRQAKRAQAATPQLAVRWFRNGKEATLEEDAIHVDWQDISAEAVLAVTTAKHVSWMLGTIKDRLRKLSSATNKLTINLTTSASNPEACSLALSLPGLRIPLTVKLSGVTGRWSISPATSSTARVEHAINADHTSDIATSLVQLLAQLVQERVGKAAELAGWKSIPRQALVPLTSASVVALFGTGVIARSIYRCSVGWGDSWALVVTFGLAGEKWWASRLEQSTSDSKLRVIAEARRISANLFTDCSVSRAQLLRVEKSAAAEISMAVLTQELREQSIRFKVETTTPLDARSADAGPERPSTSSTAVVFDAAPLVKSGPDATPRTLKTDVIRLIHTGVSVIESADGEQSGMRHSIRLTVKPGSLGHLQTYLATKNRDSDIAMNKSGALALQLMTPFGQRYTQRIRARLEACGRFNEYLTILNMYKHRVLKLNLRRFEFVYSEEPRLTATLNFDGNDGGLPVSLKLGPANTNPHHRGRVQMELALNSLSKKAPPAAFHTMLRILTSTIPAFQTFDKIEISRPVGSVAIHIHSPLAFVVEYKAPLPACKIILHLRSRAKGFHWKVGTPLGENDGRGLPDPVRFAFLKLCQDRGEGWFGDGKAACVVEMPGIVEVLMRVDGIMREFGGAEADKGNALDASENGGQDATTFKSAGKKDPRQEIIELD